MDVSKVGVVGAGLMGHGIAQISAQAGYDVVLREVTVREKAARALVEACGGRIEAFSLGPNQGTTLQIDLPLKVQVLQSGCYMPTVVDSFDIRYPPGGAPVPTFTTNIDIANGDWVVLRITDPSAPADGRATGEWESFGNAIAYPSPFFLQAP